MRTIVFVCALAAVTFCNVQNSQAQIEVGNGFYPGYGSGGGISFGISVGIGGGGFSNGYSSPYYRNPAYGYRSNLTPYGGYNPYAGQVYSGSHPYHGQRPYQAGCNVPQYGYQPHYPPAPVVIRQYVPYPVYVPQTYHTHTHSHTYSNSYVVPFGSW